MTITVSGPNGVTINFPEGTDHETINRVMSEASGSKPAAQPQTGTIEALGRGALQGATFGLSDEAYAGAKGVASYVTGNGYSDTYDKELAAVREANKRAKDTNPYAYMGGEIAGGFALPMGVIGGAAKVGKVAAEASRIGRTGRGLATGAATGAAYGFGEGEDGIVNRVSNALPSALGGAIVGAAAPTLVDVGSAIVKGATNPIRAALMPQQTAQTKVAEAFLRDAPEGVAVDGVLQHASQRLSRAQATKPDAMLADVGGQNSRDLLRAAANMPSQGSAQLQRNLDRRQGFQWSRIEKDLAATLEDGNKFGDTLETWKTIQNNVGGVAFKRAYDQPFSVKAGDPLAKFLTERKYVVRLLEKADESISGMTGENTAQMRPWELLHRVKMEMDREIGRVKTGQQDPKANWTLRDLTMLKREMVDLMGKANPQFKSAMEKYGDVAGVTTALQRGADEFRTASPGELIANMKLMDVYERKMYRLGAARAMFTDIEKGNITRDRTESLFSSPEIQKKLAVLFPDNASRRDFQRRLVLEARMADTRKAVQGNSSTAKQLAQGQEAGQPVAAINAVANATTGNMQPALSYLSRQMQAFSGMTPAVSNQIIQTMMSKGALGTQEGLEKAIERASREPAFRDQLVRRIIAGASAVKSSEGDPGTQQQPAYR